MSATVESPKEETDEHASVISQETYGSKIGEANGENLTSEATVDGEEAKTGSETVVDTMTVRSRKLTTESKRSALPKTPATEATVPGAQRSPKVATPAMSTPIGQDELIEGKETKMDAISAPETLVIASVF